MRLTSHQLAQLYIVDFAAVHAKLLESKTLRGKPLPAARLAREHALAAVEVNRANGKRGKQS